MAQEPKVVPSSAQRIIRSVPHSRSGFYIIDSEKPIYEDEFEEMMEQCSQPNWDGYDAEPLKRSTVNVARQIKGHLLTYNRRFYPHIAPGGDGTIGFEFYSVDGPIRDLFIEARPDNSIRAYWIDALGEMEHLPPTEPHTALENLRDTLRKFSEEGIAFD